MRFNYNIILITTLLILLIQPVAQSQETDEIRTDHRVDFRLVYDSIDLVFESYDQENPPDLVQLDALAIASGYLAGIQFHYERNRDRLVIIEQIDSLADDLEYHGYNRDVPGCHTFDYTAWIPNNRFIDATDGSSYQGNGVSDLENYAEARDEARHLALEGAIRAAMRSEYTDRDITLPGVIDGYIQWYEINMDDRDPDSGNFVFNIDAWIAFPDDSD